MSARVLTPAHPVAQTTEMVKEANSYRIAWNHLMCDRCWYNTPENVLYGPRGRVIAAFRPLYDNRVMNRRVYICCICAAPTGAVSKFVESPEELFCEHSPDGTVQVVPILSKEPTR